MKTLFFASTDSRKVSTWEILTVVKVAFLIDRQTVWLLTQKRVKYPHTL